MLKFYLVKMLGGMEQVAPTPTKALGKAAGTFDESVGDGSEYNVKAAIAKRLGPMLHHQFLMLTRIRGRLFCAGMMGNPLPTGSGRAGSKQEGRLRLMAGAFWNRFPCGDAIFEFASIRRLIH